VILSTPHWIRDQIPFEYWGQVVRAEMHWISEGKVDTVFWLKSVELPFKITYSPRLRKPLYQVPCQNANLGWTWWMEVNEFEFKALLNQGEPLLTTTEPSWNRASADD
jgi:hypothetical protein